MSTRAVSGSLKAVFKRYWQQYHSQGLSVHDDFHEQAWDGVLQPTGYCRVHGNADMLGRSDVNEAEGGSALAVGRLGGVPLSLSLSFISRVFFLQLATS